MLASLPLLKLSTMRTNAPFSTSASVSADPINEAPPVTSTLRCFQSIAFVFLQISTFLRSRSPDSPLDWHSETGVQNMAILKRQIIAHSGADVLVVRRGAMGGPSHLRRAYHR